MTSTQGVTFVVPVLNGRRWLPPVLDGIMAQRDGRPFEVIVVDDGSGDGSRRLLSERQRAGALKLIDGPRRGAAAAINAGIRQARHPIVCQVDQDVIPQPGWLSVLLAEMENPEVAAAQGQYVTPADAGFWGRMIGRDLEQRYARIATRYVDHVCTGNSVYRTTALYQVGLLDEDLGYGYDNDLSYRLTRAGYRLAFCREALSVHHWREGFGGYLRQQFGFGYGRLDLLARHPRYVGGDDVSGPLMMLHGPVMLAAMMVLLVAFSIWLAGGSAASAAAVGGALIVLLCAERTVAGAAAWRTSGDAAALAFSVAHLARDMAWAAAIALWAFRRAARARSLPEHSMRRGECSYRTIGIEAGHAVGLLAIVPAYNEALNLARVVRDLRRCAPGVDILVINDDSTDETLELLPTLDVRWLTLSQRLGVGGAVRTGLRYALKEGYEYVARIDGDGQHRACDIQSMIAPVVAGHLDAVIGSRYLRRKKRDLTLRRFGQSALGVCLTLLTGRRITDPTSGFWVFGPRAVRLLGRHHPTGYAEPELVLFLCRNGLTVGEVPIRMRPRLAGRTSLTPARATIAFARTVLALMMVPARSSVRGLGYD